MTFSAKISQKNAIPGSDFYTTLDGRSKNTVSSDGNNTLVVGSLGIIDFSNDNGLTWYASKSYPSIGAGTVNKIIYANGQFVAATTVGIYISKTGDAWYRTVSTNFHSIQYNGSIYVGAAGNGVFSSTDLITFTSRKTTTRGGTADIVWTGVAFIVTFSGNGIVFRSTDGINWTLSNQTLDTYTFSYDGTSWLAHSSYGYGRTSTDGINWNTCIDGLTQSQLPTQTIWDSTNSRYVASLGNLTSLTGSGHMATSMDGKTWTNRLTDASNAYLGIARNANTFVGVGYTGKIAYSTDSGTNWTKLPKSFLLPASSWNWCTGNSSRFIASGNTATAMVVSSDDGISWDIRVTSTTFAGYTLTGAGYVVWNGTMFVGIISTSTQSRTIYSSDGITWTMGGALPSLGSWTALAWNGSVWATVRSGSNAAAYSTDGINWTSATLPVSANWNHGAGIIGGRITCCVDSAITTVYTTDGITWTQGSMSASRSWQGMASNGTRLVATAYSSSVAAVSTDGITWTEYALPVSTTWQRVASTGTAFCVPSNSSAIVAVSTDGQTWVQKAIGFTGAGPCGASSNRFCVLAFSSSSSSVSFNNGNAFATPPGNFAWNSVTYGNSKFLAVGSSGSTATSVDGINWSYNVKVPVAYTLPTSINWGPIVSDGTTTVISNGPQLTNTTYLSSTNSGDSWTQRAFPVNTLWSPYSCLYANGTWVFVAASAGWANLLTSSVLYSSNGTTWNTSSIPSNQVSCLTYGAGKFLVTTTSSQSYQSVDNGVNWTSFFLTSSGPWQAGAYGASKFVFAVGGPNTISNKVVYGDVGNWTETTLPLSKNWMKMLWTGSMFILIGGWNTYTNEYLTSTDGISWTVRTFPISSTWINAALDSSNNICVISGGAVANNKTLVSSDGINWKVGILPSSSQWFGLAWTGTNFITSVGGSVSSNVYAMSPDGISWSLSSNTGIPSPNAFRKVIYDNSKFIAVGDTGSIATSTDGNTWNNAPVHSNLNLWSVAASNTALSTSAEVTLLVNGNGVNNGTIFTDSSSNAFVPTVFGNAITSTAQSKFGGSSMYFDGSGDVIRYVDDKKFRFASSDFTLEFWIYPTTTSGSRVWVTTAEPSDGQGLYVGANNASLQLAVGNGSFFINNSFSSFTANTWMHVAVTKQENIYRVFKDGVLVFSTVNTTVLSNTNNAIYIGGRLNPRAFNNYAQGYMQDVRLVMGQALYTSNFSVPTAALTTTIPNTSVKYVAGGASGVTLYSNDANSWYGGFSTFSQIISDIEWTGSNFVACGTSFQAAGGGGDFIETSSNGINWTERTPGFGSYVGISYGGGKTVMTDGTRSLVSSDDGLSWKQYTVQRPNYANGGYSVAAAVDNGVYVNGEHAFHGSSGVLYSTDGNIWNQGGFFSNVQSEGPRWTDVVWTGVNFVCVAGNTFSWDNVAYSPDAGYWKGSRLPYASQWTTVTSNGTLLLARDSMLNQVSISNDHGVTWSKAYPLPFSPTNFIDNTLGLFIALINGGSCYTSTDGINWTARTMPGSYNWYDGLWTGSVFLAITSNSTIAATSINGVTWTSLTLPGVVSAGIGENMAYGGGRIIIVAGTTCYYSDNNGTTWGTATVPATQNGYYGVSYLNGKFITVPRYFTAGTDLPRYSSDGITWYMGNTTSTSISDSSIASNSTVSIIVSAYTDLPYISYDGINWLQYSVTPSTQEYVGTTTTFVGSNSFIGQK
jgi:hypothetical protein